ncbi:uncharacterized protein LOC119774524 [Cyprinodon tularosa]|uniref:uncharacterized protein LOC119774524 n=1 Tax=Cyprinodon tularosa TaxID=77115 RepID=UPI0018E21449|nr:uncharacterized protein LOC119774524 [Cyprinodon tularosa]
MTSTTVIQSQRVKNLQVRGFHLDKRITLPPSYTRDFIPANRTHIPTKETAEAWSHLEHLREHIAPLQSCEVGLLIGYNCSQALLPREVVSGQANQPFAQCTDLGWSIVGHGNPCVEFEDAVGISHHIVTMRVSPEINSPVNLKTEELPHRESKVGELKEDDPELRKATVLNTKAKEDRSLLNRLEKFSDWSRAVQAVARLKRLIKEHKGVKERTNESTSLEERKEAELTIVKLVQEEALSVEIKDLKGKGNLTKTKHNKLFKLNPILDEDGVLRVGGRLSQAALHPHVRHPVIIPSNTHMASLLIKHFHERVHHQGRRMTSNELRAN